MRFNLRRILFVLFLLILLMPVFLWIFWLVTPRQALNILIVDKTVLTQKANEHRAFNWYLKNRKFVKPNRHFYIIAKDYKGFFPEDSNKYQIHDLKRYTDVRLDSLADTLDMAYFTDTYGIYYNDWYRDSLQSEHSPLIYGGLDKKDVGLIKRLKKQNKLILAEFNFFASPTRNSIRKKAEKILNIQWSGWTVRYFDVLDTLKNNELPHWVTRLYKEQHQGKWPFKKSGIVFVHSSSQIEILEEDKDLRHPQPIIYANQTGQDVYHLPAKIDYPYWIDITFNKSDSNELLAHYEIDATKRGDSILRRAGIPTHFPAVIAARNRRFFYFCGDYADNNVGGISVYFKYADWFKRHLLKEKGKTNRNAFYWNFYVPMMDVIMHDYTKTLKKEVSD